MPWTWEDIIHRELTLAAFLDVVIEHRLSTRLTVGIHAITITTEAIGAEIDTLSPLDRATVLARIALALSSQVVSIENEVDEAKALIDEAFGTPD